MGVDSFVTSSDCKIEEHKILTQIWREIKIATGYFGQSGHVLYVDI